MDHLTDDEISAITALLSEERLSTFQTMAGTTRAAIALHQQTLQLAGALMSVTAVVEIALRNSVCDRLGDHFAVDGWLRRPPTSFVWKDEERGKIEAAVRSAQRAAYAKLNASDKSALDEAAFRRGVPPGLDHEFRVAARQKAIVVRSGQVITQLTMYFWKRLFSRDYEQSLWKPALRRIFPNKAIDRSAVAIQLEQIHQSRNRVAHHEPVYGHRLVDTLNAVDFLASNLGVAGSDGCTALHKVLRSERAALADRAHLLHLEIGACAGASSPCVKRGQMHVRASRNSRCEHRRIGTDAAHIKPRSPDPLRS
ncbi:hypothetical protein NDK50_16775 [Paraburkholderia bryophila]|uniref:hypothetical protein n=1 Tax=Paraburkholderia bryophila TaxID=420952 RepID=UPI00234BFB2A|nr:hypothetical protein [Paraburkholderia bryophila]WCM19059.1 hypothetical protein NDK50_16775 [Paraburkholderia bryophila]